MNEAKPADGPGARTGGPAGVAAMAAAAQLIAARKVNGTAVVNRAGERIGAIYDVMIEKRSGKVAFAIMSFGGFLGLGEKYHPLPWSMLNYDQEHGGYIVDLDRNRLEGAPAYDVGATPDWTDALFVRGINTYYGIGM
jgi:sporulation protein YlmC with PRC-barrel domain